MLDYTPFSIGAEYQDVITAAQAGANAAGCPQNAVTYGTAACLTEGTLPIAAIRPQVQVKQL